MDINLFRKQLILAASDNKYDSLVTLRGKIASTSSFVALLYFIFMMVFMALMIPIFINWYTGNEFFHNITVSNWSFILSASLVSLSIGMIVSRRVKKYNTEYDEILDYGYTLSPEDKCYLEDHGFTLSTDTYPVVVLIPILSVINDIDRVQRNFINKFENIQSTKV